MYGSGARFYCMHEIPSCIGLQEVAFGACLQYFLHDLLRIVDRQDQNPLLGVVA
jgi:hypothetical protein